MRPIIVVALLILALIACLCVYNITAPQHDNISGTYVYGGNDLYIQNLKGVWGNNQVRINELREENIFELYSPNAEFPSGIYTYSNGNLIGHNNGVTFLKR